MSDSLATSPAPTARRATRRVRSACISTGSSGQRSTTFATSISALRRGEVDWLDAVAADHVPLITQNPLLKAEVTDIAGLIGILRFNHLHPPFNTAAVRRALLRAIDQADVMAVLAGADRRYWHDRVGLFPYGTPLCYVRASRR